MSIQTFSIVIGTKACNAGCPFCVSRQTGFDHVDRGREREINVRNLKTACAMCGTGAATTLLMTGKGEPTLYPFEILDYLKFFEGRPFAPIELQTNGLSLGWLARDRDSRVKGLDRELLLIWRHKGLDTIALSVVGVDDAANAAVYHRNYPPLDRTIAYLRQSDFTVRLCVMMMHGEGCVSTPEDVERVIEFCRRNDVGQLTIRPIRSAQAPKDDDAADFVRTHGVSDEECGRISAYVEARATRLRTLMHGAAVYDFDGQNICVSDCLTKNSAGDGEDIRTLIFYSDGTLTYDWQHHGALLLQGWSKPH